VEKPDPLGPHVFGIEGHRARTGQERRDLLLGMDGGCIFNFSSAVRADFDTAAIPTYKPVDSLGFTPFRL
jgi:hypothetical protein